jgi:DNA-binding MarR family transcriptional regulator
MARLNVTRPSEVTVLRDLLANGESNGAEISRRTGLSPAAVTYATRTLRSRKLIAVRHGSWRNKDEGRKDGRTTWLSLADDTAATLDAMGDEALSTLLANATPSDRKRIRAALERLQELFSETP